MSFRPSPQRHWRSHGTEPLPTPAEAPQHSFSAFPSWVLRIECDRCGKVTMHNENHAPWRDRTLFDVLSACAMTAAEACPERRSC
jgi:hypothetical protein